VAAVSTPSTAVEGIVEVFDNGAIQACGGSADVTSRAARPEQHPDNHADRGADRDVFDPHQSDLSSSG